MSPDQTPDPLRVALARERVRAAMFGVDCAPVKVGRFSILRKLGQGGMGVVYAAHDSQLDRTIAVKLIRSAPELNSRLLREAKALARLSDPNVVQVFEVGESNERLYIAMEFVQGETLAHWLRREPPRSWREIVAMFAQAGRGLLAAHEAGIQHRDFKPANVLVNDRGVAKVADFGLARLDSAVQTESPVAGPDGDVRDDATTVTRGTMGTPAYMSPEQFSGQETDVRTDQFSFCVGLWEALYREHPFEGDSFAARAEAVTAGRLRRPASGHIPSWLHRALLRGLENRPEDRHPDMGSLLRELQGPTRRWRWALVAAVVVGSAAGAGLSSSVAPGPCDDAASELAAVWSPDRRDAIERAFTATGAVYAASVFDTVEAHLDHYALEWAQIRVEGCEATHVHSVQSSDLDELQQICLERRLQDFDALLRVFSDADAGLVEEASSAVVDLPALEPCADAKALRSGIDAPAVQMREAVARVRGVLASGRAHRSAGRFPDGLELAREGVALAADVDYAPLQAEARLLEGEMLEDLGDYAGAERALDDAFQRALASSHDEVAVEAAAELAHDVALRLDRPADADRWLELGEALVHRSGAPPAAHQQLLNSRATIAIVRGDFDAAYHGFVECLHFAEANFGSDGPTAASAHFNIGVVEIRRGNFEQALEHFTSAAELRTTLGGEHHPDVATAVSGICEAHLGAGRLTEADAACSRSLRIREAAIGSDDPQVGVDLDKLAWIAGARGDIDLAVTRFERAVVIIESAHGSDTQLTGSVLLNFCNTLVGAERAGEAEDRCRRAAVILERAVGPEHSSYGWALSALASVKLQTGHPNEALALEREALQVHRTTLGDAHPEIVHRLTNVGTALTALGRPREAIVELEAASTLAHEVLGPRSPQLLVASTRLCEAHEQLGARASAESACEAAIALTDATGPAGRDLGRAHFALARLQRKRGADANWRRHADEAARIFAEFGLTSRSAELAAWRAGE